jgi:hypothetical protein
LRKLDRKGGLKMSETKYKGVKKSINLTAGGCSIVEGKKPGVTFDCEKYLDDEDKLRLLSGPVKVYHISELISTH